MSPPRADDGWPQMERRRKQFGRLFALLPPHQQLGICAETRRVAVTDYHGGVDRNGNWYGPHLYRAEVSVARTWAQAGRT